MGGGQTLGRINDPCKQREWQPIQRRWGPGATIIKEQPRSAQVHCTHLMRMACASSTAA